MVRHQNSTRFLESLLQGSDSTNRILTTVPPVNEEDQCVTIDDLRNLIGDLRLLAKKFLAAEKRTCSVTPTTLVLTALSRVKLQGQDWGQLRWENRAHFFGVLTTVMRHALIDFARRHQAKGRDRLVYYSPDDDLFRNLAHAEEQPECLMVLEEALEILEDANGDLAQIIQQYYYFGYSVPEIAQLSDVSEKTIDRELKRGRCLLRKFIGNLARSR